MKITALRAQPAHRRAARRAVLWATWLFRRMPDVVLGAVVRRRAPGAESDPAAYRFALEYFYALGVEREGCASGATPPREVRLMPRDVLLFTDSAGSAGPSARS